MPEDYCWNCGIIEGRIQEKGFLHSIGLCRGCLEELRAGEPSFESYLRWNNQGIIVPYFPGTVDYWRWVYRMAGGRVVYISTLLEREKLCSSSG